MAMFASNEPFKGAPGSARTDSLREDEKASWRSGVSPQRVKRGDGRSFFAIQRLKDSSRRVKKVPIQDKNKNLYSDAKNHNLRVDFQASRS
jgi:hypothetical protein